MWGDRRQTQGAEPGPLTSCKHTAGVKPLPPCVPSPAQPQRTVRLQRFEWGPAGQLAGQDPGLPVSSPSTWPVACKPQGSQEPGAVGTAVPLNTPLLCTNTARSGSTPLPPRTSPRPLELGVWASQCFLHTSSTTMAKPHQCLNCQIAEEPSRATHFVGRPSPLGTVWTTHPPFLSPGKGRPTLPRASVTGAQAGPTWVSP